MLEAAPAPVAIRQPTLPASADRGRSVSSSLPVPNSARSRSVKVPGLPKPPSKNVLNDDGAGSGARIGTWGDRQYMIPLPKHRVEAQSEEWAEEQVHGGKSWKAKNCLSAYDLLQRERAQQQPEADGSPYHARPGFGATTIPVGSASGGGGGSLRGGAVSSSLTSQLGQRVSSSAAAAPCGSPQRAPALRVTTHLQPVGPPSFRSTMMLGSLGRNRSSNNLLNNLVHEEEDEGDLAGGSGDEREKAVGGNDGASSSGRRANGDSTAAAAAIGERGAGSNGTRGVVSGSPRSLGGIGRVRAPHAPDAAKQQGSGAAAETAGGHAGASDQVEDDEDEEAAQRAAAWRWRFSRRWNAEQARPVSEKDAVMSPDATEEALQYLRACGGTGVALQVARTASSEYSSALRQHAGGGSTLGNLSLLGAEMLLADGSPAVAGGHRLSNTVRRSFDAGDEAGPGGRSGRTAASSSITTVARRAQQLLQEQRAIEQQAEQRWQASIAAAGDSWVGNLLTGVEIDDWGTFRFVAIKLRDRANRQKILVRGHNGSSEANLMEGINRKVWLFATVNIGFHSRPFTKPLLRCSCFACGRVLVFLVK